MSTVDRTGVHADGDTTAAGEESLDLTTAPPEPGETEVAGDPLTAAAAEPVSAAAPSDDEVEDFGDDDATSEEVVAAKPLKSKSVQEEVVEIATTIVCALLIAVVLRIFLFQPFTIPSASMEPNLYEGDYIVVSKWSYGYSRHSIPFSPPLFQGRVFGSLPERGDVAVFKLPRDGRTDYIKRVIGLPGDRVQMRDGRLFLNGEAVPTRALGPIVVTKPFGYEIEAQKLQEGLPGGRAWLIQDETRGELDDTPEFVVPAGHLFVMGDNRDNSIDSRVSAVTGVGFVPVENLVGKAQIILFSWEPGARLFNPVTWFTKVRPSRFFHSLQ